MTAPQSVLVDHDPMAVAWLEAIVVRCWGTELQNSDKFAPEFMVEAFKAGRAAGFAAAIVRIKNLLANNHDGLDAAHVVAMVDAFELIENMPPPLDWHAPDLEVSPDGAVLERRPDIGWVSPRKRLEVARHLLGEAAERFREYERHWRATAAGGPEGSSAFVNVAGMVSDADRAAELASRINRFFAGDYVIEGSTKLTASTAGLASVTVQGAQNFTTNDPGFNPERPVTVNGFFFQRTARIQVGEVVMDIRTIGGEEFAAELGELRTLLNDVEPAVRFVNSLATMTDAQAEALRGWAVREKARERLGDDGLAIPPTYTEEQRVAAAEILRVYGQRWINGAQHGRLVDGIATALGLERIKP